MSEEILKAKDLGEGLGATPSGGRTLRAWLFNPFQFIAGGQALALGLIVVAATSLMGSLSNTHFDGVLDTHTGRSAPIWLFLLEGGIDWVCAALVLWGLGAAISRTRFRAIDVLGTQALARWPFLLVSLAMLAPPYRRYSAYLVWKFANIGKEVAVQRTDMVVFGLTLAVSLVMLVWAVALMYRAFTVSCNVRGGKAIGTFVGGLFLAEVLSKVLVLLAFTRIP